MSKSNAANERIKRRYLVFLRDAKGRDEASIDSAAAAISRFERYTRSRDFKGFHFEQARGFKNHLLEQRNQRTGKPLSAATVHSSLAALKAFFIWVAQQPGYASRIKFADADYFSPPENLSRIATARRFKACPTMQEIRAMLGAMPTATDVQMRDRALVAFAILSGARDRAIISFRMKHIDIERALIQQDARDVRTKGAKTFPTWFFPVGQDIRQIFVDWYVFLRDAKNFGADHPLFPKTKVVLGDDLQFQAGSLGEGPWANANPVRQVFRDACARAGLPYYNPHLFRNTLVQLAYDRKLDAEAFKAWSQNLGHESCLTTFSSYGTIQPARQAEIIRNLAAPNSSNSGPVSPEMLRRLADQMEEGGTG